MPARRRAWIPWAKALVWVAALVPFAVLLWDATHGGLEAEPVKDIQHRTGKTAVVLLFAALAVTPLRRLSGFNDLVKFRRLLGLFSFFYAVLHVGSYLLFDLQFNFADLAEDVVKRPFLTVGFLTFLILLALAATSPTAVLRWMGGKRWQALHRLVYVAAIAATVHFVWGQKKDISLPLKYAAVLAVLLGVRLLPRRHRPARNPVAGGRAGD